MFACATRARDRACVRIGARAARSLRAALHGRAPAVDCQYLLDFRSECILWPPRHNDVFDPRKSAASAAVREPLRDSRPDRDPDRAATHAFLQHDVAADKRKDEGLEGVLREIFPIESYDKTAHARVRRATSSASRATTPDECRQLRLTYGRPFRVWLRLTKEQPIEEEVYLGDMPIMIGGGEFIINGAERVVVSQLHRSPRRRLRLAKSKPATAACTAAASSPSAAAGSSSTSPRRTRSASASTRAASSRR